MKDDKEIIERLQRQLDSAEYKIDQFNQKFKLWKGIFDSRNAEIEQLKEEVRVQRIIIKALTGGKD